MTKPQIEFIGCNLEQMREVYAANAANIVPFCTHYAFPGRPFPNVTDLQETRYYNSAGDTIVRIFRITYCDGQIVDYPLSFRVGDKVYNLTEW
jgi:hypothetical protein